MIYLLYGSDTDKARAKLHDLVGSLVKKKPDASHERLNDETFSADKLEELMGGMGLFSQKAIIEMINVFRNKDAKETVLENIKDIGKSDNIFVFLEGELNKTDLAKFEKNSEKIQEFELKTKGEVKKEEFKIFSLTDAFGRRDKKMLWVLYTKAKMHDIAAEEIHGILFWQVKAVVQAAAAGSAKEAGLNPFVYQKSKAILQKYSLDEIKGISSKLVSMYHNARRGIHDFDVALEKFILEV
jgi:DNA polymerase III delta subunit